MNARLEAWLEGRHVGQFVEDDGQVRFDYDEQAPSTPISLSLPRDRPAAKRAAEHFLENLVPDEARAWNSLDDREAGQLRSIVHRNTRKLLGA